MKTEKSQKRNLTLKQRKLVEALPHADSIAQAGEIAGYSHRAATHKALKVIQDKMPDVMDRLGLTDEALVSNYLLPGLRATKLDRVTFMGSTTETHEDPDWTNRRGFLDMAAKLKGIYQKEKIELDVAHTHEIDLSAIPDAVLYGIVRLVAVRPESGEEGSGRNLQAEPVDLAIGR